MAPSEPAEPAGILPAREVKCDPGLRDPLEGTAALCASGACMRVSGVCARVSELDAGREGTAFVGLGMTQSCNAVGTAVFLGH